MIKIAVLGYGTVGSGVVEVLERNRELISQRCGRTIHVKYILDLREFPGDPYEEKVVHDFQRIIEDPEIRIICETMGGAGAAYQFTRAALERGISVCTSNKELVAKHGPELLTIARREKCSYLFEASVGGGIPVIRTLNNALTAERIEAITGILNGTTNYILSKMEREGADFASVLREAQEKGYAEANPEADVEGHDACRKIAILSSLMTGRNVNYEKIQTEGITGITAADFLFAKEAGCTIKLLAQSKVLEDGRVMALVSPCMIGKEHPLAQVSDVFNAVFVTGNMLGDSMYYGRGAGKLPTASAVVGDVIDCARSLGETLDCYWEGTDVELADAAEIEWRYFVRAGKESQRELAAAFPGSELLTPEACSEEFGLITPAMKEKDFDGKWKQLGGRVLGRIRFVE